MAFARLHCCPGTLLGLMIAVNSNTCVAQADHPQVQLISTSELAERIGQAGWLIVDVRDSNAFNGWFAGDAKRGGHISGATNLPLQWMTTYKEAAVRLIESKGLKENKIVLCGDSALEARAAASLLHMTAQLPRERMFVYTDGIAAWSRDKTLPMDRLFRYEKLVPPEWLNRLIHEGDTREYRIVEVAWRNRKRYRAGHLPGAIYLDTDEIEAEPEWNVVSADKLERALLRCGISKNTQVIVYGRDSTAAARAAVVMMYAGVADVRLLNGGYRAWQDARLPVEKGDVQRRPARTFGIKIPARPNWIIGIEQAKQLLATSNGRLVSIRSWPEYIGQTSGYSYIKPKGRISGAVWGHGGTDHDHMEDFRNPDGTLRDYHEIAANWSAWGVEPDNQISFYCGTGWRASEAFFAAYLMGYENISVYDGGWYEWSAHKSNPIETGKPDRAPSTPSIDTSFHGDDCHRERAKATAGSTNRLW